MTPEAGGGTGLEVERAARHGVQPTTPPSRPAVKLAMPWPLSSLVGSESRLVATSMAAPVTNTAIRGDGGEDHDLDGVRNVAGKKFSAEGAAAGDQDGRRPRR